MSEIMRIFTKFDQQFDCFPVFISCFYHFFSMFFAMFLWFGIFFYPKWSNDHGFGCIFHFLLDLEKSDQNFYIFWFFFCNFDIFCWKSTKNLVVSLCLFLVSITFFPFFYHFWCGLLIFFVKYGGMIVCFCVFSTFWWFWTKVLRIFTNFEFSLDFFYKFWTFCVLFFYFFVLTFFNYYIIISYNTFIIPFFWLFSSVIPSIFKKIKNQRKKKCFN